ncbi:hypothetical protein [Caulobacter vibrioides]|uniref:hypothetical protein n=1 Tax=Caulobacter vibrioides TaxID=155892 RepID=UPI000F73DC37|nr:hypothetical protein [Caulobacter vibrioides]
MSSDNSKLRSYGAAMEHGQPFIRLRLDVKEPIELTDFVSTFTSVAAEYERFIKTERPDRPGEATLFVKEVRAGSIIADLVPFLATAGGAETIVKVLDGANTVAEFVEHYGGRLSAFLKPGGRVEGAGKGELKDFYDQVAAVAATPQSSLEIAAFEIENGAYKAKAAFKFDTSQAREIRERVEEQKVLVDHKSGANHPRVLMVFTRSDVRSQAIGKRSGELVKIEALSPKSLPLIYASELAEQQIKHEITEAEDNVFKKGFVVDVSAEVRGGKMIAYRVTELHQVIDLDDE